MRRQFSIPERLGGFGVAAAGAAAVWPAFAAGSGLGVPCPLRWATGIPCPGCGLTTAAVDLVHGRPLVSIADNPAIVGLAILTIGVIPVIILRHLGVLSAPKPWPAGRRRRIQQVMLVATGASWAFQLHRFGIL